MLVSFAQGLLHIKSWKQGHMIWMFNWNDTINNKTREGNGKLLSWMATFYPIHYSTIYFIYSVVNKMKTKTPLEIRNQAFLLLFVPVKCISKHYSSYLPREPDRKQLKQLQFSHSVLNKDSFSWESNSMIQII